MRTAFGGRVAGHGLCVAPSFEGKSCGIDAIRGEVGSDGSGPVSGQGDIVRCFTGVVSVSIDLDLHGGVVFQELYNFIQLDLGFGFQLKFIWIKEDRSSVP